MYRSPSFVHPHFTSDGLPQEPKYQTVLRGAEDQREVDVDKESSSIPIAEHGAEEMYISSMYTQDTDDIDSDFSSLNSSSHDVNYSVCDSQSSEINHQVVTPGEEAKVNCQMTIEAENDIAVETGMPTECQDKTSNSLLFVKAPKTGT